MKYTYKITFEIESNIVPKFVEYALKEVLEETKISISMLTLRQPALS